MLHSGTNGDEMVRRVMPGPRGIAVAVCIWRASPAAQPCRTSRRAELYADLKQGWVSAYQKETGKRVEIKQVDGRRLGSTGARRGSRAAGRDVDVDYPRAGLVSNASLRGA